MEYNLEYFDSGADLLRHHRATTMLKEAYDLLNDWEKKFIGNMADNPPKKFSKKQIEKVDSIYNKFC